MRPLLLLPAVLLVAGGCTGDRSPGAVPGLSPSPGRTASAAPSATASPSPSPSPVPSVSPRSAGGCPATSSDTPAGAATGPAPDVDGDGRADTLWLTARGGTSASSGRVGITTASGATFSASSDSASPIGVTALAVQPTGPRGPVDVLLDDGRSTRALAVDGCGLAVLRDAAGAPYVFDTNGSYGTGTGIGCVGPGGERVLTGLDAPPGSDDDRTVRIRRTPVRQSGTTLRNGRHDDLVAHRPQDDRLIDSARSVTCGELTLDDGVHEPEG